MTPWSISLFSGLSVFLVALGLLLVRRPDRVRERLAAYRLAPYATPAAEGEEPFSERVLRPALRQLARAVIALMPHSVVDRTRHQLVLAGNPRDWDARDYLGLQGLSIAAGFGAGLLIGGGPAGRGLFLGAVLGTLGYLLPNAWLSGQVHRRQQEITRSLPDALDLLTICVEAGLGFDGALNKVVDKWNNALSREFGRVLSEIRMGKSRRDALRDIVPRTEVPALATFIAAVVQADQLGVSIGNVLHTQAEQLRLKRRQRAEELAHQAPIKMVFPMILFIFPAMYVVILGPALPSLLDGLGMR